MQQAPDLVNCPHGEIQFLCVCLSSNLGIKCDIMWVRYDNVFLYSVFSELPKDGEIKQVNYNKSKS